MRISKEALFVFTLILAISIAPSAVFSRKRDNCCILNNYKFVPEVGLCMRKLTFSHKYNVQIDDKALQRNLNVSVQYYSKGIYVYKKAFYLFLVIVPPGCTSG